MEKSYLQKLTIFIVLLLFTLFIYCERSFEPVSDSFECNTQDNPVNFIFKYGVTAKNILNTFDCTFQKDMILDPSVITQLKLSTQELDSILALMQSIHFFNYPDTFSIDVQNDTAVPILPSLKYSFFVEKDSVFKTLYWNDCIIYPDTAAEKLKNLCRYIIHTIKSKSEYKALPEPRGGYD
jgi:hypothetical protein